jgi:integrase
LPLLTGCESLLRVWNSGDTFVQDALYWGYVLALVTGMRPAEIAQIRCQDLIAIEDEGELVWFIDLTDRMMHVKSKNARRMIPLVPLVIALGLVTRRDLSMEAGHERLIPEWPYMTKTTGEIKHGHYLSKSWQYIKRKFEFSRDGVTLYSARHTFAQRLDEVGQVAERSRHLVMGHSTHGHARLTYGARHLALGIAKLKRYQRPDARARVGDPLERKIARRPRGIETRRYIGDREQRDR